MASGALRSLNVAENKSHSLIPQNVIEKKADVRFLRGMTTGGRDKIDEKGLILRVAMIFMKTQPVKGIERLQPVHHARQVPRAKAVIDVDHADVGRATVEHAQQRGEAVETRAITHAGRHGDHGHAHHAGHHAGQRSLHARYANDDARLAQVWLSPSRR